MFMDIVLVLTAIAFFMLSVLLVNFSNTLQKM